MATVKDIFNQAVSVIKNLTLPQKFITGVLVAGVVGGMIFLSTIGGKIDYHVLFSGLSAEDAASVIAKLKEQRIDYRLSESASAVLVPAANVYETRLNLAAEGLPRGGGVGFEIFDQISLGTTDFVQKLNYQRAVQGELARTIRQFKQVRDARVHIATPKESVFVEDTKPPSASVSLTMAGQEKLAKEQIMAIVHLVASAVPGLTSENITVVDTLGRLLFRKEGDDVSMISATQLEYQLKVENALRTKVESLLEEVVGVNKALARVTVDMDFNKVDVTEENFDPDGQVIRSEQLSIEQEGGEQAGGGIPGVKGELSTFTETGGAGGKTEGANRKNITRNYEISRKTRHIQESVGTIKRLSVAVMVDGVYEESKDKDGKKTLVYKPRGAEELDHFVKMTQNAIGFDPDRGDKVEVVAMPFYLSSVVEPEADPLEKWRSLFEHLAVPFVLLLVAVAFIMFVIRPFIRLLGKQQLEAQRQTKLAARSGLKMGEEEDLTLQPLGMTDKEKIYKLAQSDPERAADLVRRWLREGM
ncbi:MAG: flagellar M-ring protein FliF [Desulfobulbaceae bacterium]|nr:flagellar M-ring protein FliF [Desulfobulbaceae bacterium]